MAATVEIREKMAQVKRQRSRRAVLFASRMPITQRLTPSTPWSSPLRGPTVPSRNGSGFRFGGTGPTGQITNPQFYTDGTNNYGTGIGVWARTTNPGAYSTPVEATGEGTHTDAFTYATGARKDMDVANPGPFTGTNVDIADYLVLHMKVDSTVTAPQNPTAPPTEVTKTLSANAVIQGEGTVTSSASAVIQGEIEKTLSANAVVQGEIEKTLSANAVVQAEFTKTVAADAVIEQGEQSKTVSADAVVQGEGTKTVSANAVIQGEGTKTVAANAVLQAELLLSYVGNAVISTEGALTANANAVVAIGGELTLGSSAVVQGEGVVSLGANAVIEGEPGPQYDWCSNPYEGGQGPGCRWMPGGRGGIY